MIKGHDLIGLLGVGMNIYAYARMQWHRDYAKELSYSLFNCIGSIFIVLSLLHDWNLSSFVSNATWAVISVYGVYRCLKYMRKHSTDGVPK